MSSEFAIRLTIQGLSPEEISLLRSHLSKFPSYLVVQETGTDTEKLHWHAVVHSDQKIDAIRNSFTRLLNESNERFMSGNGRISVKKCTDFDGALRYVCKGESKDVGPHVVMHQGLFDIADLHSRYWDVNAAVKAGKVKAKSDWLEECLMIYKENNWNFVDHRKEIFDMVLDHSGACVGFRIEYCLNKFRRVADNAGFKEYHWQKYCDKF